MIPLLSARMYILDKLKISVGAYSFRKLRRKQVYSFVVRRDSDDEEMDIGFIRENLNTAQLLSFCGAASGYIVVLYDQSGNDNHAQQIDPTKQVRIVTNGTLEADAIGKASLQTVLANSTVMMVSDSASLKLTTKSSVSVIHNPVSLGDGGFGRIFDKNDYRCMLTTSNVIGLGTPTATKRSNNDAVTIGSQNLHTITHDDTVDQTKFYKSGEFLNTTNADTWGISTNILRLFNDSVGNRAYDGKISEIIIFNTPLSESQRKLLENDQGKYYGITIT